MMISLIYVVLAILALSFLIFIHELGHYFMARRVGMRVETFSIGFGHPIFSWERDGVKWQIGWLLFGGFVKITGQELDKEQDPYTIPGGFFAKSPFDRIKVAFMGPFVNIVFGLIIFSLLWADGGREKNFSEFTHKIGWVDPHSELYALGVRPGDEIASYDGHLYESAKDHLYAPMTSPSALQIKGFKNNYQTGEKIPFDYTIKPYPHPASLEKGIVTGGILQSARFIIYNKHPGGQENPIPQGAPLQGSGIQYGDRIIWIDGELIFSDQQLNHILNDGKALLTVQHGGKVFLRRVPRVPVQDLKFDNEFKQEMTDWQYEARLNNIKISNLYTIPYGLTNDGVVEKTLRFIDKDNEKEAFPRHPFSELEQELVPGDRILAVDGKPISHSYELLAMLQKHQVNIIVERSPEGLKKISWQDADEDFNRQIDWINVKKISQSIGTRNLVAQAGNIALLKPVTAKPLNDFTHDPRLNAELIEQKKEIESIDDPEKKAQIRQLVENRAKQLKLGLPSIQDRRVDYNPNPLKLFTNVINEIRNTFVALITGALNLKWLSGPVGIVQVVHDNWMVGVSEALFWIGAISLNLGIFNLFPIPLLDGGTILFCLGEIVTGKRLSPKAMERLTIPFAILLIGFFIYLTYNDLIRAFGRFWM